MHYFEFATKDTTIYEASASVNTGKDEILEIRKDIHQAGEVVEVSRALIKFDLTYISASVSSGLISSGSRIVAITSSSLIIRTSPPSILNREPE